MSSDIELITPDWPAPANVWAYSTTRQGGVSVVPYQSLNLGDHVGDVEGCVNENRQRLIDQLKIPSSPAWLQQVHGCEVYPLGRRQSGIVTADASYTRESAQVCVVMTADCLPLLITNQAGTVVAAVHAGWRGLCNGVVENTLSQLACPPEELMVWLGPAIGPQAFEVGAEVREAFIARDPQAAYAFTPRDEQHWLADIYLLARQRLQRLGVSAVYGGNHCTYSQCQQFFSYRRDGVTGRMASLIWLA